MQHRFIKAIVILSIAAAALPAAAMAEEGLAGTQPPGEWRSPDGELVTVDDTGNIDIDNTVKWSGEVIGCAYTIEGAPLDDPACVVDTDYVPCQPVYSFDPETGEIIEVNSCEANDMPVFMEGVTALATTSTLTMGRPAPIKPQRTSPRPCMVTKRLVKRAHRGSRPTSATASRPAIKRPGCKVGGGKPAHRKPRR